MEGMTANEVPALETLTKAGCSFTPTLYAWKEEKQASEMWVPGGFIAYILMEKLPGTSPLEFSSLDQKECQEIRESFKQVWK
jgi:hypothetical protein